MDDRIPASLRRNAPTLASGKDNGSGNTWGGGRIHSGNSCPEGSPTVQRQNQVRCFDSIYSYAMSTPLSPNSAHIRHLRQSISITGLSVTEFQEQVNIIADVEALLSRAVGEDNMQPCTIVGNLDGHSVLQASNRYFTPRKDAPNASEIPLAPDVDPYGILAKAVGSTLMHTEENVVYYYECTTSSDGKNPRCILCWYYCSIPQPWP